MGHVVKVLEALSMRYYKRINGKLSPEDVDDIVRRTVADHRLEGMNTSLEEIDMLRKFVAGEISDDEYTAWIFEHVGVKS